MARHDVTHIEIVEDFSASARCDEGFLKLRRLRCRNRRADGSSSVVYRVDVVDRPRLDAVAVLIYRRGTGGLEVFTRTNLRPAAYFRKDLPQSLPDDRSYLLVEEIVAGVLEPSDLGEQGLRYRAAEEAREEAGLPARAEQVELLGGPFFVAPGIISEKIHLTSLDATGLAQAEPAGDGSPLEEGGAGRWRPIGEALAACRSGEIQDAKTELALARFVAAHPSGALA